jgi:4-amino-4-deoxy-L-arabinose transferase-like glycosyltransferase
MTPHPAPPTAARPFLALALLVYAAVCAVTLRPEETWTGGDFALYLMHGRDIAEGLPYAATGFVQDQANALMSPAAYPPGFPLLIAPVWAMAGLDLVAVKLLVTACLAGLLAAVYALARPVLGWRLAVAVAGIAGFMPALFDRRDQILSDVPAAMWCYAALVLYEWLRARRAGGWRLPALAVVVALACATRTAGFALAGALMLAAIVRWPGPWRSMLRASVLGAVVLGAAAAFLAGRFVHADGETYLSYFAALREEGARGWLLGTADAYSRGLVGAWGLSYGVAGNLAALAVLLLAVAAGWLLRLREDASAPEAFLVAYAALLAVFPVRLEPVRYLVPIAPLLVYYAVVALAWLAARLGRPGLAAPAAALAAAALFVPYYVQHSPLARAARSVTSPASEALFAAVRQDVAPGDLVLARNPRVLALFTRRRAATWPAQLTPERFWSYAGQSGAGWVLDEVTPPTADSREAHAVVAAPGAATLAYGNDEFLLWRLPAAKPGIPAN